jgi:hypothetical protein
MKESDWKLFSKLRDVAVERLYDRVLVDAQKAITSEGKTSRELVHETRDALNAGIKEVRDVFDSVGFSRTHARLYLMGICVRQLLTEEEVGGFSEELRAEALRWLDPECDDF